MLDKITKDYINKEVAHAKKEIHLANRNMEHSVKIDNNYELHWVDPYQCFSLVIHYTDGDGKPNFYNIAL